MPWHVGQPGHLLDDRARHAKCGRDDVRRFDAPSLQELGEEGAIQVFENLASGALLLGAVGTLQFEVVAQRLQTEYKVDAIFEPADINTARWLTFPDNLTRRNFEREQQHRMARDVDGNLVYLASTRYNLDVTREKWSKVAFHASREHGQKMD